MMRVFSILWFSVLMMLVLAGCSRKQGDARPIEKKMAQLGNSDVFLRVNGENFTKQDFVKASTLLDKITRMRAKDPLVGANARAERAQLLSQSYVVSDMKRRALMAQYAKKNNVEASPANLERAEKLFLGVVDRKKSTVDDIAKEIGGEEGILLKKYLKEDAVDLSLREHFDLKNTLSITDEDVNVVSNRWRKACEDAVVSNKLERSLLEKALAEIRAGGVFSDVAKKYSIAPDEGVEWAELDREDMNENTSFTKWGRTAKPGDISGVIEMDDGMVIAKLVSYEKDLEDFDPNDPDQDDPPDETWNFVRIVRKFWDAGEPMTREEIVQGIFAHRSRLIQKKIGDAIMAEAKIEWPFGTNLFEKVSKGRVNTKSSK